MPAKTYFNNIARGSLSLLSLSTVATTRKNSENSDQTAQIQHSLLGPPNNNSGNICRIKSNYA